MCKIGFDGVGVFDNKRSRTIWQVDEGAKIIFNGKTTLGHGCKINVSKGATLTLGHQLTITAESTIICKKDITIGDNVLISWDVLMMDTDFHKITDMSGNVTNGPQPIKIGDNVWIGCRSLILKGTEICSDNVMAANSTLTENI